MHIYSNSVVYDKGIYIVAYVYK